MPADPVFEVRHEPHDGAVVVAAQGEIDLVTSPELRSALLDERAQAPVIVLDLRAVTFIDSSGLGVIVGQQKRSQERGERFAVAVGDSLPVQRILDLSGLVKVLDIVDDPSERLTG